MNTRQIPPQNEPPTEHPGAGRPKRIVLDSVKTPAEVRALLLMVLDADTANKMVYSLRKKIAKGNIGTLEFLFDRLLGRPAVNVHHDMDGALTQFMQAWQELANAEQTPPLALEAAEYRVLDDDVSPDDADDDNEPDSATEDAGMSDIIPIV